MTLGTFGDTYIDAILAEYIPIEETNRPLEELLTDESDQLQLATLMELRAARISRGQYDLQAVLQDARDAEQSGVDVEGTYRSETKDLDTDWTQIDLDFVTEEIDLRGFGSDIELAFVQQPDSDDVISYSSSDSPVVGIPISTSWIQLRGASGSVSGVNVEAWGDS